MNVFSCDFYNLPFKDSLSKYQPVSLKSCTVAIHYLGLLDLLHRAFTIFCIIFKLFIFTTKALSYRISAYISNATSYSSANSLYYCQCAVTCCFLCSEQHPTAVLSSFPFSNPFTRFSWHTE